VTIDRARAGEHTALVLLHKGFAGQTDPNEHAEGWSDCLDRLPPWLAGTRP